MRTWTPEEQAAHREGWAAALLSDLYPQATGYLKADDGFCCLGVACEVAAEAGIVEWVDLEDESGYRAAGSSDHPYNDTLPEVVRNWLGLEDVSGETVESQFADDRPDAGSVNTLVELNDEFKWDFRRIAELITAGGVRLAEGGS